MKKILCVVLCLWMLCMTGMVAFAADEQPYVPVTGIKLSDVTITIVYGGTAQLTATVQPADAIDKRVTWTSSNDNLVKVDANGNLTAAKDTAETPSGKQNVTITATSVQNPSVKAQCIVTVDNDSATKTSQTIQKILTMLKTVFAALKGAVGGSGKQWIDAITDFVKKLVQLLPKSA